MRTLFSPRFTSNSRIPVSRTTSINSLISEIVNPPTRGIYAVLLAFVVFVVWGQFNEARSTVDREAAALVDLHRTASGLAAVHRERIQAALRRYMDEVMEIEWTAMALPALR